MRLGKFRCPCRAKLLRVLQESEYERVGDEATYTLDVRVIAATNRDLEQAVEQGRFREDLYYRLSVFPIEVPPLRERGDDVLQLASHFLERACKEFGLRPLTLSRKQAALLTRYSWPGNIRELKNVIERAAILSQGKVLRLDLAMADILDAGPERSVNDTVVAANRIMTDADIREMEKRNMIEALRLANGKVSGTGGAAELVGVKPTTFSDRMRKHGVARPQMET